MCCTTARAWPSPGEAVHPVVLRGLALAQRAARVLYRSPRVRRAVGSLARELGLAVVSEVVSRHLGWEGLSDSDRAALRELQQLADDLQGSLRRHGQDIGAVRADLERRHGYTLRRLEQLGARVDEVDRRLYRAERSLGRLDRLTSRQRAELGAVRRTLVDYRGRIVTLERATLDHEDRLVDLDGRLVELEELVRQDRVRIDGLEADVRDLRAIQADLQRQVDDNRGGVARNREDVDRNTGRLDRDGYYDKHVFSIGVQALYPNAANGGDGGLLGGSVDVGYLFGEHFGVFAQALLAPTRAQTASGYALTTDPSRPGTLAWDHYAGFVGGYLDVLPGTQPVTARVGVGGGVVVNELTETPDDAGVLDRTETAVLDRRTNAALLARLDLGVSPGLFPFEPFVTVGVSAMLDPVAFEDPALLSDEFGTGVFFGAAGVRYRFSTASHYGGAGRAGR